jgi:hypothetical protein
MPQIHYIIGDATLPIKTPAILPHICNDVGKWGSGYVVALSNRFGKAEGSPEAVYRKNSPWVLGHVTWARATPDIIVANMVAQHSVKRDGEIRPLRLDALDQCLNIVYMGASLKNSTVHMPRIGCDRAGGNWSEVEPIILKYMSVDTYVYDLPK